MRCLLPVPSYRAIKEGEIMIWQEDLERTALLHFKYKMFVFLEDDFGMPGQASKILKAPVEKLQKKKK